VNYINNNTNYHPQNQGLNQQQRPNYSGNYQGWYYRDQPSGGWKDESLLEKKGNLGRPIIPIAIGPNTFEEAVCDSVQV
jgi:hypothetical protein